MADVLTTKKPWVLLLFALVALNAIVAFTTMIGTSTVLDDLNTQSTIFSVPVETTPAAATPGVTALNMVAFFALVLDLVILYGMWKGMTWTWWLLTFTALSTLVTAIFGVLTGQPIGVLAFIVNLVMVAALLKKEVVHEFKPSLNIIPQDGLW